MERVANDSPVKSVVLAPTARTRKHIERELAAQAVRSAFFRQQLIAHPRSVLKQVFGAHIPETIAIARSGPSMRGAPSRR